jgi:hypothetical protein
MTSCCTAQYYLDCHAIFTLNGHFNNWRRWPPEVLRLKSVITKSVIPTQPFELWLEMILNSSLCYRWNRMIVLLWKMNMKTSILTWLIFFWWLSLFVVLQVERGFCPHDHKHSSLSYNHRHFSFFFFLQENYSTTEFLHHSLPSMSRFFVIENANWVSLFL